MSSKRTRATYARLFGQKVKVHTVMQSRFSGSPFRQFQTASFSCSKHPEFFTVCSFVYLRVLCLPFNNAIPIAKRNPHYLGSVRIYHKIITFAQPSRTTKPYTPVLSIHTHFLSTQKKLQVVRKRNSG